MLNLQDKSLQFWENVSGDILEDTSEEIRAEISGKVPKEFPEKFPVEFIKKISQVSLNESLER